MVVRQRVPCKPEGKLVILLLYGMGLLGSLSAQA